MDENKDDELKEVAKTTTDSKEKQGKAKSETKVKLSFSQKISHTLGEYMGEFKKIIWPSREVLIKQTFTVVVTSLMVGAIIATMDYGFKFAYNSFITFFTR